VQFYSTILTAKYFYPATRSTVLAMALSAGWISAPGGINAIPLNERFYTGGPNELRAFGYQEVGPLDQNGIPLGGNIKLVWNVFEVRQTIYKMFGMALFGELGNIYLSPGEIKFSNLRQSLGTGLRVNSPVGLLRLDYAFNLSPRKGEPGTQLYFSVGQAF
ncbi:MAG: BamA/TamA family outer membrane protein, partial [Calditrichota bacterium]